MKKFILVFSLLFFYSLSWAVPTSSSSLTPPDVTNQQKQITVATDDLIPVVLATGGESVTCPTGYALISAKEVPNSDGLVTYDTCTEIETKWYYNSILDWGNYPVCVAQSPATILDINKYDTKEFYCAKINYDWADVSSSDE